MARHPLPSSDPVRSSHHGLSRFVPIAVFLAILGSIASGAFEALGRGDRLGAIIPLVVLGVAAVSVWRSARRRSNRASGITGRRPGRSMMPPQASQPIAEWHDVDERTFREESSPSTGRRCCAGWSRPGPPCRQHSASHADVVRYLTAFDNGSPVDAILMPPQARGRIAYNDAMDAVNFAHRRLPVSAIIEQLSRYALFDNPPSVAVQSALIPECLPGFAAENRLPVLDEAVAPRIWLGNRVTVPAHVDESDNVACVVAGRRRFTLFPPEQVSNLYIGPLDLRRPARQ